MAGGHAPAPRQRPGWLARKKVLAALRLPFLRWVHRFERAAGVPYRLQTEDRVRNISSATPNFRLDPAPVLGHFAKVLPKERLAALQKEAATAEELASPNEEAPGEEKGTDAKAARSHSGSGRK